MSHQISDCDVLYVIRKVREKPLYRFVVVDEALLFEHHYRRACELLSVGSYDESVVALYLLSGFNIRQSVRLSDQDIFSLGYQQRHAGSVFPHVQADYSVESFF